MHQFHSLFTQLAGTTAALIMVVSPAQAQEKRGYFDFDASKDVKPISPFYGDCHNPAVC